MNFIKLLIFKTNAMFRKALGAVSNVCSHFIVQQRNFALKQSCLIVLNQIQLYF